MSRLLTETRTLAQRTLQDESNPYVSTVLADQPFAYWRMDDSLMLDRVNGLQGTVNGSLTFGAAGAANIRPSRAVELPSPNTSNYIDLPVAIPWAGGFAAEWWIAKWSSGSNSIPIRSAAGSDDFFLFDNGGTIRFRLQGNDVNTGVASSTYLGLSTFTHMVCEYDPAGPSARYYINGTQVYNNSIATLTGSSGSPIRLFRSGTTNNSSPCVLDEVAFYPHPLGAARVAAHYAAAQ